MNCLIQQYKEDYKEENDGMEPKISAKVLAKFREQACEAKKFLSEKDNTETDVLIDSFGTSFETILTREEFEEINSEIWTRMFEPVTEALKEANIELDQIDKAVVVGGSTRIPRVRQDLIKFFGKDKVHLHAMPE